MNHEEIKEAIETRQEQLLDYAVVQCERRLKELVKSLKHFTITGVNVDMGAWRIEGKPFDMVYVDKKTGQMSTQYIMYWIDNNYPDWKPQKLTKADLKALKEFASICDMLVDMNATLDTYFKR